MISKKDMKMMNVAEAASKLSTHRQFALGAVVANNNGILGIGFNKEKSHPLQKRYNKARVFSKGCIANEWSHIHAELDAMLKVKDRSQLVGATIYVSRSLKSGVNGCARPCAACMDAAKDFKIKKLVYTTEYGIATEFIVYE